MDGSETVVDQYAYDLWGLPTTVSEQVPQQLRYRGYWYDDETGWYWLQIRAYDPVLKRVVEPEPSGQDGQFSYAYAGDNPVDASDPSGFAACGECSTGYSYVPSNGGVSVFEWEGDEYVWQYSYDLKGLDPTRLYVPLPSNNYYMHDQVTPAGITVSGDITLNAPYGVSNPEIHQNSAQMETAEKDYPGYSPEFVGASVDGKAPENFGTPSMSMNYETIGNSRVYCKQYAQGVACVEVTWSGPIGRAGSTPGPMYPIMLNGYAAPAVLPQRQLEQAYENDEPPAGPSPTLPDVCKVFVAPRPVSIGIAVVGVVVAYGTGGVSVLVGKAAAWYGLGGSLCG